MEELIHFMRKENLMITSSRKIAHDTYEMKLQNDYMSQHAKPGQFLHISIDQFTLRRPISIADIDRKNAEMTIIFKVFGPGTEKLATYHPKMVLNALGPNGNGFPLKNQSKVLLIGGGVGIPPLHFLGKKLFKQNVEVISILGFQDKKSVFYEDEFNQFSKTHIMTNDGSYGEKGFVTDLLDQMDHFDQYYACGPLPMLQAVKSILSHKPGYLSLEERMGCGVGACFACVIPTDDHGGYQKICQDGPVFLAEEIKL